MTASNRLLVAGSAVALLLAGCATGDVSVTSGVVAIDRSVVKSRPVELPGGYDVDTFDRLRMMVADGEIQSNSQALKNQREYMNIRFQSEMAKHRRFDFNAVHGLKAANATLDTLKDQGQVEEDDEDDSPLYGKSPALLLGWTINIQQKTEADGKYAQTFKWYCTVNATVSCRKTVKGSDGKVKYNKGDIAFTRDFDLPVITKEQTLTSTGAVKSGFSYKSDSDVQSLMQEIVIAASQRIADDLGRQFPVGGKIVGALGDDLMTMDKGTDDGVEKAMEMVVFARYDGVDVPLANASASPSPKKTQLEVWRFADSKHAKMILGEIAGNPKKWVKDTGNELFAVRVVPPEDAKHGTRFE